MAARRRPAAAPAVDGRAPAGRGRGRAGDGRRGLLVLDEPSANLDPRARRELLELLAGLDRDAARRHARPAVRRRAVRARRDPVGRPGSPRTARCGALLADAELLARARSRAAGGIRSGAGAAAAAASAAPCSGVMGSALADGGHWGGGSARGGGRRAPGSRIAGTGQQRAQTPRALSPQRSRRTTPPPGERAPTDAASVRQPSSGDQAKPPGLPIHGGAAPHRPPTVPPSTMNPPASAASHPQASPPLAAGDAVAERLAEMTHDLLAAADADRRLTWTNPAWEPLLGWTADELRARVLSPARASRRPRRASWPSSATCSPAAPASARRPSCACAPATAATAGSCSAPATRSPTSSCSSPARTSPRASRARRSCAPPRSGSAR